MSVLIAYASAKGSTGEIAERIAEKLRESCPASTVKCSPISAIDVTSLPSYTAVIVGSAIHAGSWLSPARRFIHNNAIVLKEKPMWAFSVGMPPKEEDRRKEEQMIEEKIRKTLPNLRRHELFEGRFNKQDLPWFGRIIISCCIPKDKAKFGDARDWIEINAWAEVIGKEITALSAGGTQ
ncbi:Flavodoxin domain-containing protein [Cladophialophora immunda]|nr:Flavodoxin domain-containing protein [Cladophialophora immunda]